eukprot:PhF_6_TR35403/c0_g2_i3/m.51496
MFLTVSISLFLFLVPCSSLSPPLTLSVNCSASSTGSNFTTLQSAVNYISSLGPNGSSAVHVLVSGMCTSSSPDTPIVSLSSPQLLHGNRNIVFESHDPSNPATLLGGVNVPISSWSPVSGKPGLYSASLQGISFGQHGIGAIGNGGFGSCTNTRSELYAQGFPMTLARYPNLETTTKETYNGPWNRWMRTYIPSNNASSIPPNSFLTSDPYARRWVGLMSEDHDVWVHGYWGFDWADKYVKVTNITSYDAIHTLITYSPATPTVFGMVNNARFRILNVRMELDTAGEYYIDNSTQTIYFYPLEGQLTNDIYLSTQYAPAIYVAQGVSNVKFVNFNVFYMRTSAVIVAPAPQPSSGLNFTNLNIAFVGGSGISIPNATNTTVSSIKLEHVGCSGIYIGGGNELQLAPSRNVVSMSYIQYYARWTRTYAPGITVNGVAIELVGNTISNAPHQAISGSGNGLIITHNDLSDLCFEVIDSAAVYFGRSWVRRGNLIGSNSVRNVRVNKNQNMTNGYNSVFALYLDDQQSGFTLENNVLANVTGGILVGGGRDNVIQRNVCQKVETSCVMFDNRGKNWEYAMCAYNSTYVGNLVQDLFTVNYNHPPYSTAYPTLPNYIQDRRCTPINNYFLNNTCCEAKGGF